MVQFLPEAKDFGVSLTKYINVINGIVIQRRKSNRDTNTGKKIKQTSVPKPTASTKKEKINASDVVKLSLDERKKLYEKIDSIPKKGRTKQQKLIRKKLRRSFTAQVLKDIESHKRLAKLFDELTARGCYCMLTNHNTDLINELYGNKGYRIDIVSVKRMINSDASNRVGEEVIICNYS